MQLEPEGKQMAMAIDAAQAAEWLDRVLKGV
jgi:hypothetical protein